MGHMVTISPKEIFGSKSKWNRNLGIAPLKMDIKNSVI
jgi:hypothetical protein